jgi:NAD(P)-dependent dehydrogenase (short-subunit alcohol dehydrogenase family)
MANIREVALITGAATGIGEATARAFFARGCHVVLADRDEQRGRALAAELNTDAQQAVFVYTDVSQEADVARLHSTIREQFGRLDAACNNAGIEGQQAITHECPLENFDRTLAINLRGVFLCLREQLAMMKESGGAIVNMASVAGLVGFASLPAYCASKGGVIQLTRTAALEYATANVRVNAVCPGAIKTEMIDRITHEEAETEAQFRALHPMERFGTAEEVADTVVWLCSKEAGFITGQALAVDGGMVAR